MAQRAAVVTGRWTTVKETVAHPDHDGVVGDLMRDRETGHYQLLEYRGDVDNYVRYAVPHKWALSQDAPK